MNEYDDDDDDDGLSLKKHYYGNQIWGRLAKNWLFNDSINYF